MLKIFATIGSIQVIAILATILRAKIIAVMLGPEGVGIISVIDQIIQLTSYICALSLPFAAVKFLSRSHSISHENFIKTYSAFLKALLILSLIGISFLIITLMTYPNILGNEISQYQSYILLAVFSLPAMMLGGFLRNALASAEKPNTASALSVFTAIAFMLAAYFGITADGIQGFYWANIVAGFVISLGTIVYLNNKLNLPLHFYKASIFKEFKSNPDIISFAAVMSITTIAYSGSYFVARYAVLHNYDEATTGLLHALISIAMSVSMILSPINGLFLTPKLNRHIPQKEKITLTNNYQQILIFILAITTLPFVLFPQTALYILFSSEFTIVGGYLYIFVIAACVSQAAGVYQALLIGFDDIKSFALITTFRHILFAAIAWFTVPHVGLIGVGYAFIISASISLILFYGRLRFKFNVKYPKKSLLLGIYSLSTVSLIGMMASDYSELSLINITVKGFIFLLFAISLLLFLTKEERYKIFNFYR